MTDNDQPTVHADVYSDGGCQPNPGPGGWGAVVRFAGHQWFLSGNDPATTSNRIDPPVRLQGRPRQVGGENPAGKEGLPEGE